MDVDGVTERGALDGLGAFASATLEADYRAGERVHDVRIARAVAVLGVVVNIPFGVVDYVFQHGSSLFAVLVAARIGIAATSLLVLTRIGSLTAPRARDRLLLAWGAVIAVASVAIVASRPPGFGGPLATGMILIAGFALIVPASFRHQLTAVAGLVVSFIVARTLQGPPGTAALVSTSGVIAMGVLLSLYASLQKHRAQRELFFALHEQRTLREALEGTLAEIRTLRGIVPICSFCHKIRDEAGDWHRVDTYVTEHTHASFSHGFCPTCESTHYGEGS